MIAAVVITLSWIAPIEREDNTPLDPAEIAAYRVYRGAVMDREFTQWGMKDGNPYMAWWTNSPGPHCFTMTTVDTGGKESAQSNRVCQDFSTNPPRVLCQ